MPSPRREVCVYIGIDPGLKGGIASILPENEIVLIPMPETEKDIWEVFSDYNGGRCYSLIEQVHSMPGQGVASTFKFGTGYGGLRMALTAAEIPFETVRPQDWQKAIKVKPKSKTESKDDFKKRLRAHCQRMYPKLEGITLKTCDALLIATYLQRKTEGRL